MTIDPKDAFVKIYTSHEWKGRSLSGPGSDGERTQVFRGFLEAFLREHAVTSVLDCGCGDWSYSQLVDWTDIDYTGVDVVPDVIARNQQAFGAGNIRFLCVEPTVSELPEADLFLCKEVLQHLPSSRVHEIVEIAKRYRHAILINDIEHDIQGGWRKLWRWRSASPHNVDIPAGSYRLLSLRDAPFSLHAEQVLLYPNRYAKRRWMKEVLVWTRPDARPTRGA